MPHRVIPPDIYQKAFPMPCPICRRPEAMPYKATTSPGSTLVDMRCRGCGHEWQFEMQTESAESATNPR